MHDLEDPFGLTQVAQMMLAEIDRARHPEPRTSSLVASDTTIWPPCPTDINRAARFNAVP